MEKIKVLSIPADQSGIGYYRSILPHATLNELFNDKMDVTIDFQPDMANINQYDIIHFHKDSVSVDLNQMIQKTKGTKTKLVIDLDDYWNLGNYNPLSKTPGVKERMENTIRLLRMADYVTTTTDLYKNEIKKHNPNVVVLPNSIDPKIPQFIPSPTKSKRIRFGIICGSSHEYDMQLLQGLVDKLYSANLLDKIQFVLCGYDTRGEMIFQNQQTGEIQRRPITPMESVWYRYEKILTSNFKYMSNNYRQYLHMFNSSFDYPNVENEYYRRCWTKPVNQYATHYNNIDVLLAPLKECDFNKYKSQLKVIESGFFKKPIIAQDFGPYTIDIKSYYGKNGVINKDGNGLLVQSDKNHKQWFEYIKKIVNNPEIINEMGENLYNTVNPTYSSEEVAKKRYDFYCEITK